MEVDFAATIIPETSPSKEGDMEVDLTFELDLGTSSPLTPISSSAPTTSSPSPSLRITSYAAEDDIDQATSTSLRSTTSSSSISQQPSSPIVAEEDVCHLVDFSVESSTVAEAEMVEMVRRRMPGEGGVRSL